MLAIEERLLRLEDIAAIADLRARYVHHLDNREWDAFIDLFVPDGSFEGLARVQGHAELRHFFSQEVTAMQDQFWHFCTNGTAYVNGDRATGRLSMEFISVTKGVSYVSAGHYDDELVRTDSGWKFQSRRITFYFYSPLKDGFTGVPPQPPGQET